jgi:VanZ family protein
MVPGHEVDQRRRCDGMIDRGLWALTAAFIAVTLWFSFVAPPPGADLFTGADRVGHAIAYFTTTLSFLFAAVWRPGRGIGRFPHLGRWFPLAAIVGGALIEIAQEITTTRTAEVYDVVAEAIGTGAAVAVHALIRRRMTSPVAHLDPRG